VARRRSFARRRESGATEKPNRLGVYVDDVYRIGASDGGRHVSTDRAFVLFACEVGTHFDELVLLGRSVHSDVGADYVLPASVQVASLPHYDSVRRLGQLVRATLGTAVGMWRALADVDLVWIFGPHPFALLLATLARLRRKAVVLGVRQDTLEYFRARLPNRRWLPALAAVRLLDLAYRVLGRRLGATVVGRTIARRYGGDSTRVLPMTVTLVRAADVAAAPPELDWSGTIELLTIGRLDAEKNPLLVVDLLAALEARRPGRFRLTWLGRGPLADAVHERAAELGVAGSIRSLGYLPHGPELLALYRRSHIFVHVSLTEGVPQVLVEAVACGIPIVATDVGGVRDAVGDAGPALLVPPRDRDALVTAIEAIVADPSLRERLGAAGRDVARSASLERESARVAAFLMARAHDQGG
jgi:glycosyltransferase involved in cell wall biosynthesis